MPPRIGGFEILGVLGAGAMGRVYLARTASSRLVAVKVIRPDLSADPHYRRRFAREIQAARSIGGAFTAAVVDAEPEAETPWLATEYIPAPTLAALVEACGPLPCEAVSWLAAGCAEALERIHRAGLVHRDVKPGNILVTARGPVVIDFGLAFTPRSAHVTTADASPGTPAFMAPEQLSHGGTEPTAAADVYALGAAMLFAATGHPPYPGPGVESIVYQLLTGEPDLEGVPAQLAPLLAQCLDRSPEARPSCADVLRQTAPYLADQLGPPPLPRLAMALLEEYERAPIGTRSTPVDPTLALVELDAETSESEPEAAPESEAGSESEPTRRPRHSAPRAPFAAASGAPFDLESSAPADPHAATHASAGSGSHASGTYDSDGRRALTRSRLMVAGSALAVLGIGGGILYGLSSGSGGHSAGAASKVTTVSVATTSAPPPRDGGPGGPGPGGGPGQTPATPPRIWIAPAGGGPHTKFVLDGANWPPQVPVTVLLSNGDTAATQPFTAGNGSLVFPLTGAAASGLLPNPLPPGTYTVTAVSGPFQVSARFTVSSQ
jgi:serine/threonine protein kinase